MNLNLLNVGFLGSLKRPAIAIDTDVSVFSSGTSYSPTLSITIGSNSNRILIVRITYNNDTINTSDPTSVKLGTTSLTKAVSINTSADNLSSAIYYLKNPPTGAGTITVNFAEASGTQYYGIMAMSLYNVDQTSGIGTTGSSAGRFTTTPGSSLTPNHTGAWIVTADALGNPGTISANSDTQDWKNTTNAAFCAHCAQHKTNPTIGSSNTLNWTCSNGNMYWASVSVEVIEA